ILATGIYAPMALPDGSIMVPIGLLHQAQTDDELAYILGHELGHVRLGHFADDEGFREKRRMAAQLTQAYATAATLSQAGANLSGQSLGAGVSDAGERSQAASDHLHLMMNVLAEPAWARGQ